MSLSVKPHEGPEGPSCDERVPSSQKVQATRKVKFDFAFKLLFASLSDAAHAAQTWIRFFGSALEHYGTNQSPCCRDERKEAVAIEEKRKTKMNGRRRAQQWRLGGRCGQVQ